MNAVIAQTAERELTGTAVDRGLVYVSQGMVDQAFALNFDPLVPEPETGDGGRPAAGGGGGFGPAGTGGEPLFRLPGGGQSAGVTAGGGPRKLSDYATPYFDPRKEAARITAIQEAMTKAGGGVSAVSDAPLTVIDWGPRGFFSSAVRRPSLYVVFSEPMVPLAALGLPSDTSPLVTINPPLKGSFRWYGTGCLSFEADEPCRAQQSYRITVNPQAASLSGKRISGETSFGFYTEALKIKRVAAGEEFREKNDLFFSDNEAPPEAAREISLYFNYPVTAGDIQDYLAVSVVPRANRGGPAAKPFTLSQAEAAKLIVHLGDVPFESEIRITLKKGAKSANATLGTPSDAVFSLGTPGPFRVQRVERIPAYGSYRNVTEIHFNGRLRRDSVPGNIRTEPAVKIGPENIEISGTLLWLRDLPFNYGDQFTLIVDSGVEDIYGRKLSAPYEAKLVVPSAPPPRGGVRFLDWAYGGPRMLESQFDPRYLFEYRNVTDKSWYSLSAEGNPFSPRGESPRRFTLNTETNRRWFADMDLKPYLKQGRYGFVQFEADLELLTAEFNRSANSFKTGTSRVQNALTLQVTDLGITARTGFNKTIALVTSLSTGKPVENALVRLISPRNIKDHGEVSLIRGFAEGRTDRNGLVLFNLGAGQYRRESADPDGRGGEIYVYAEKDGDRAVFQPEGHNPWAFNVENQKPWRAEEVRPVTFVFTDRGLYKPGEILSFRGIDRSLALGDYLIYQGRYAVVLETDSYRDRQIIASLEGETSESGGFYGRITLPDDLTPQGYRLVYRRLPPENPSGFDAPEPSASVPVTVAFFERLKFEASIAPPERTLYAGDTINLSLKAAYLGGGSLAGASYEESWYRETTRYAPASPEAGGYYFGPRDTWDGRRNLSSGGGTLGAEGTAALSQKTAETSPITGAAVSYNVETRVTDLSNQMIAASRSVMVHPARFYLGVAAPVTRGFPKTGQDLSFPFIVLKPSGERSGPADWQKEGKLAVEFLRDEWHLVQQEGAAGYIYDQYVKETISEGTWSIPFKSGGTFTFSPPRPGYYTARLSAQDAQGGKALTEYCFYVTGQGAGYWNMSDSSEISLTPDQEMYNPGDTAQVLLRSALPGGYYLVTLEREGIYTEEVKYLEEGTAALEIPIARNYVPLVYVSVSSYSTRRGPPRHEYGGPDLDKPKSYFGVTALRVNPRVKAFTVSVETGGASRNRVYQPGETVTLTLRAERNGRPLSGAELTLVAVDRGVLDLINYHIPDPIDHFYERWRFPLSVAGGDSRSLLIDPVTYSVKSLAGGDDADKGAEMAERRDFNPTAVFEPLLKTGADGRVKVSFKLPDNITTYRVTVFGVRGDLFALRETEITARNKINVQRILPRRLRERDTAEAGVLITNLDSAPRKVTVSLALSPAPGTSAAGRLKTGGGALVDGAAERTLSLKAGENGAAYFDIAAVKEGYVNCTFTIRFGALNEKLVAELVIEKPYVMETVTTLGAVAAEAAAAREGLVIPSWADNGAGNLSVSLDATRLGLLDSAVSYLFRYPYGCLEQRSSAALPLVIFGDYLDAFSLKTEVADPGKAVENEMKTWARYQRSDGGFPYWPEGSASNFYVSLRIAHIIALAKQKKLAVPGSINAGKLAAYLNGEFRGSFSWRTGDADYPYRSYLQAYALYVFSLLGQGVEVSRLTEITGRREADAGTLAYAGMTCRNLNRSAEAAAIAERIRGLIRFTPRGADLTDPRENDSRFFHAYYGNKLEQLALVLEFFVQQYPGDQINGRLLQSLLNQKRAGGYWDSTAVTARVLSAVDALIRAENLARVNVSGTITLAGTELFKDSYRGPGAKPTGRVFDFKDPPLVSLKRDAVLPLDISRSGGGALYYNASLRYAIPAELQSFRDEGLGVFVTYHDAGTGGEIAGTSLRSGKTYLARARLSSSKDRTFVALRVPLPSGVEVLDAAFVTTPRYAGEEGPGDEAYWDDGDDPRRPSAMVIMDNEVRYFWDSFSKGEAAAEFFFRAVRRGVYPTPPVQAECMYEGEIFGRSPGLLYTIE
jgi:uncharacterized protein YfaS (alpha-2-macroglobulin family)